MEFIPTTISDVVLIEPKIHSDGRGFFVESYRKDVFEQNGIRINFVQDNHNRSAKGVLRGLHFQIEPKAQAKLIRVLRGKIFDVVVDVRKNSLHFGKHISVELDAESKKMLYIPVGFAHGFCALEEGTEVLYKVSDYYSPQHERGIRWDDPALAIKWPKLPVDYIISERDQKLSLLKDLKEV